jgi:hypothetical protein
MLKQIFTGIDFSLSLQWLDLYKFTFIMMILGILLHYTPMSWNVKFSKIFSRMHWSFQVVIIFVAIIFIYQFFSTEAQPFIYLDF